MAQKFDILEALQSQGIDAKVIKVRYSFFLFFYSAYINYSTGYQDQQSP